VTQEASQESQPLLQEGRLLGLDIGETRTGLALSNSRQIQASPLKVLRTKELLKNNSPLAELIEDYEVVGLVVGLPLLADGAEGQQARRTRSLAAKLVAGMDVLASTKLAHKNMLFYDERFSSAEAKASGHSLGLTERDMRGHLDSHAAANILQAYLDQRIKHEEQSTRER
jgi:putative Holliday junction resolvase